MKSRIVTLALALLLMVVPTFADETPTPQIFPFLGQAIVPDDIGGMLSMYGVMVVPPAGFETPLPLDFDNYQYTVVITDLELTAIGGTWVGNTYEDGMIAVYEDNLTMADYVDQSTFVDGAAILTGTITTLNHRISGMNPSVGTVNGLVDWTGGTRLDDMAPEDQTDWFLNSQISRYEEDVEPGYTEQWNGKLEPQEPIVGSEQHTWSAVKNLMR
jgi:hypothetical protein